MKFSVNAIRFLNKHHGSAGDPAPEGVEKLVETIGARLGGVEETIPFGERFKDVIIAKIVECRAHENSDHLHVCKIDDGGRAADIARDEHGHVQVVCGAPNVREGLLVAWLPPGATVPESLIKGKPFVLGAREIRGELSNGMLASARELSLSDDHDGILEITGDSDEVINPGASFAEQYHLDGDVVIDIENKMFTHRPDCFGWLGIARELEGIQGRPYKSPQWYALDAQPPDAVEGADQLLIAVRNELPELVPRFIALTMRDVQVHASPLWLQIDLARAGIRPINNIVDYTNWFMVLTGQPLHAYDYDKVRALDPGASHATLVVRQPHEGEQLTLLSGKQVTPRPEAIMIATEQKLIGIGGVMGGHDTEVSAETRNIIIECANFDMYSIRKTSMSHGLFTDAVTRFSKGQSPLQNRAVICKIADEIARFAGGKLAGLWDDNHLSPEVMQRGSLHAPVAVEPSFVNERLGLQLSADDISRILGNVEFKVEPAPLPKRAIVLHGRNKTPGESWYPWFKAECEQKGLACEVPAMPAGDVPVLADWLGVLNDLQPDADTVLVGHSRGGMTILRWLEQAPEHVRVKKVVLVAANNPAYPDGAMGDFYDKPDYDFAKIRSHCDEFVLFHSRDDDFVPLAAGEANAAGLHGRLRVYEGVQHFGNNLTRMPAILQAALGNELLVSAPFWRTDIAIPEDIVEEVGRLHGFDNLPLQLPKRDLAPAPKDALLTLKSRIRAELSKAGASEVLTYSFVHGKLLTNAGQNAEQAFQLGNALSPDLQYFRLSLTPSLLDKIHANIKAGHDEFALFEVGKVHGKSEMDDDGLPREFDRLALAFAAEDKLASKRYQGAAYFQARHYLETLAASLGQGGKLQLQPLNDEAFAGHVLGQQMIAPFEPSRSAVVLHGGRAVGVVGEYRTAVQKAFKLPRFSAGFELFVSALTGSQQQRYTPLPKFPKVEQDICLKVPATLAYQTLYDMAFSELERQHLPHSMHSLQPLDIFQRTDDTNHKQVTFRFTVASYEKTLRDEEVSAVLDNLARAASEQFGAERI